MCQSYIGIYPCRHFVITTEHCDSCPPEQRIYNSLCSQPNLPISRDQNFVCEKCDEKKKWSIGRLATDHYPPERTIVFEEALLTMPPIPHTSERLKLVLVETGPCIPRSQTLPQQSTSSATAEPGRSGIPRSQTVVSNGTFPPRVLPRLMPRPRRTETNISNYPTAINCRETSQNSPLGKLAVDQQSYKCEKHTQFATNSFAVRCCDPCQRILARANRPYAEHIGLVLIVG